jgi:hypothetical protein
MSPGSGSGSRVDVPIGGAYDGWGGGPYDGGLYGGGYYDYGQYDDSYYDGPCADYDFSDYAYQFVPDHPGCAAGVPGERCD